MNFVKILNIFFTNLKKKNSPLVKKIYFINKMLSTNETLKALLNKPVNKYDFQNLVIKGTDNYMR